MIWEQWFSHRYIAISWSHYQSFSHNVSQNDVSCMIYPGYEYILWSFQYIPNVFLGIPTIGYIPIINHIMVHSNISFIGLLCHNSQHISIVYCSFFPTLPGQGRVLFSQSFPGSAPKGCPAARGRWTVGDTAGDTVGKHVKTMGKLLDTIGKRRKTIEKKRKTRGKWWFNQETCRFHGFYLGYSWYKTFKYV